VRGLIEAAAYGADVAILAAYAAVASGRYVMRLFHWANALGSIPIMLSEVIVGAWPAFVLTSAFGVIGWMGVITANKAPA
jgi:hypothetical protein